MLTRLGTGAQVLAVLLALAAVGCTSESSSPASPASPATTEVTATVDGQLPRPRAVHRATRLPDGSVLLTGGCSTPGCGGFDEARSADVYGADGTLTPGPTAAEPRANGTATLLADGRVLLTGGYPGEGGRPVASIEVYDPTVPAFRTLGELREARADHTATLLDDGRVLIAGGSGVDGDALATTELFSPATDTTEPGPPLSEARAAHVAVRLGAATILVGGTRTGPALASTDVLSDGAWRPGPELGTPRVKAGIAAIGPDRAWVIGGSTETEGRSRLASTEVLTLGGTSPGPELAHGAYKLDGAIARLPDGRVVIPSGDVLEVYDPVEDTLAAVPNVRLPERSFRTVTPLGPTTVLVAGGYDDSITPHADLQVVRIPAAP